MNSAIRLRRRTKLWEAGTARVGRIAFGGVIFAVVILLKVIESYHQVDYRPNEQKIAAKQIQREKIDGELKKLEQIEKTLSEMKKVIEAAPWNAEIDKFRRFIASGGGENVRDKARATIEGIAEEIQARIVKPIRATVDITEATGDVAAVPKEIEDAVDDWKRRWAEDSDWYLTIAVSIHPVLGTGRAFQSRQFRRLWEVRQYCWPTDFWRWR